MIIIHFHCGQQIFEQDEYELVFNQGFIFVRNLKTDKTKYIYPATSIYYIEYQ